MRWDGTFVRQGLNTGLVEVFALAAAGFRHHVYAPHQSWRFFRPYQGSTKSPLGAHGGAGVRRLAMG
jgi:hypothetical protein